MRHNFTLVTAILIIAFFASCTKQGTPYGNANGTTGGTTTGTGGTTTTGSVSCTTSPYRVGTVASYTDTSGTIGNYTITITKDTVVNGNTYQKGVNSIYPTVPLLVRVASNGDVYQAAPPLGDLSATEMIYFKALLSEKNILLSDFL